MWYGWTGTELEVDLSRGKVKKNEGNREMYEKYLTGRGLLARHFWDRVPPETEPFSPNNLLIFGCSPLVGTAAPAACRAHVVFKSPLTDRLFATNMGGFWGPELKLAGYDTIIISGKSPAPVYLYINNDRVEIRDASHLWGKDVIETQHLLREELHDNNIQTLCIGPAGESRVHFASIEHGPGSSMSRGGGGAIMGDKRLKAIAVRGTQNINIARPGPFFELCEDIMNQSAFVESKVAARWPDPEKSKLYLNAIVFNPLRIYRNFDTPREWRGGEEGDRGEQYAMLDLLAERKAVTVSCYNCQEECIHAVLDDEGDPIYWKCGNRFQYMNAGDIQDWGYSLHCSSLNQRHGMDSRSASNACRFAIDLYQKGILTKEDTDGQHLEWGNPETIPALLEKITHRRGIGDVLANGVYEASRQIGRGAEQCAFQFRGLEFSQGETRAKNLMAAVRKLVSDEQGQHHSWWMHSLDELLLPLNEDEKKRWKDYQSMRRQPNIPHDGDTVKALLGNNPEGMERFLQELKDPEERKKWEDFLELPPWDETEIGIEILSKKAAYDAETDVLRDMSGICQKRTDKDDFLRKKASSVAFETGLMSHATGLDLDEEDMMNYARRVRAVTHAYNAILGERMDTSELESRLLPESLVADNMSFLRQTLAETNRIMGYSAEGIPEKEHLEELGLGDIVGELKRRELLP